jgi:hypothetical protein
LSVVLLRRLKSATLSCVAFSFALLQTPAPAQVQTTPSTNTAAENLPPPTEEVPYVQTPMHVVHRMLQLAEAKHSDLLWDLGSGDGRIVIAAAKRGARGVGYEIDPNLIVQSRINAKKHGVSALTQFIEKDLFTLDFSRPSVVTLYLLPEFNLKLRPKLLAELSPSSRIVSHEWDMGDWPPDETLTYWSAAKPHGTQKEHRVYLWVVPARVAGRWRVQLGKTGTTNGKSFALTIEQRYQRLTAQANRGHIRWIQMRGREVSFEWRDDDKPMRFNGRLQSSGNLQGRDWVATPIRD